LEKIEVKVVSGEFADSMGVVTALKGSDCEVKLHDGVVTLVTPSENLETVPVQKNSSVIILQGELKGNTGKLIGIDGRDGIVKMDLNQDIKIVDVRSLAVYVPSPSYPPTVTSHSPMSPVPTSPSYSRPASSRHALDAPTSAADPEPDLSDVPARIKFLLRRMIRTGDLMTLTVRQCKQRVEESFENGEAIVREYKQMIMATIDEEIQQLQRR
jgi:hypothetical protein